MTTTAPRPASPLHPINTTITALTVSGARLEWIGDRRGAYIALTYPGGMHYPMPRSTLRAVLAYLTPEQIAASVEPEVLA